MKSNISRIVLATLVAVAAPQMASAQQFRVDTSTTGLELEEPARPASKPAVKKAAAKKAAARASEEASAGEAKPAKKSKASGKKAAQPAEEETE
mgnify:CR=1 FL=1